MSSFTDMPITLMSAFGGKADIAGEESEGPGGNAYYRGGF
jgi:hypothetical protein